MNSDSIQKSLLKELPFKIGEQYELNEFNLKTLESTFSNGLELENYEYIKEDFKTLFGLKLDEIILQYNADILSGMIYKLAINDLDSLVQELNNYLPLDKKLDTDKMNLGQTFTVFQLHEFSITLDTERVVKFRVFKFLG
tara:strand:- start:507 stop:926 length:420 start_codon:yes stop_codon:yes gene_type:complete